MTRPLALLLLAVLPAASLPLAACAGAAAPRPLAYECTMCKTHRPDPGVCCGAPARACRYACSCGRHSDAPTPCCGRDMPPAEPGRCDACKKTGITGTACCGGRMK